MTELILTEDDFISLRSRLFNSEFESFAILKTNVVRQRFHTRLLVCDVEVAPADAYRKRNTSRAVIDPEYLAPIVKKALKTGKGLVFVHTHPWDEDIPEFSSIDDQGEKLLQEFLKIRKLSGPHVALVFGKKSCRARFLGTRKELKVVALGGSQKVLFDPSEISRPHRSLERQVRLLGSQGQHRLDTISVGIVGLGGTGSIVAEELAYLGVKNFLLVDPDIVDETNLNRLVGARRIHIGRSKVWVAQEQIKRINPKAKVVRVTGSILNGDAASRLLENDFVFCCTDSQASRATLNQIAYQYMIPTIDIGVSISTADNKVDRVTGRVQLLSPGQACLTCQELLDPNIVRQEFMNPEERAQDPYFLGIGEPQPAVISLNSTMSSLAVTMFLAIVADLPSRPRHILYDALQGKVRPATASRYLTCIVCSKHGALAKGNEWSLPVHQHSTNDSSK